MSDTSQQVTVTLSEAAAMLPVLAASHSLLLLSAPGVGKTTVVQQAAARAGLDCRSLLGTQVAPEDVIGVPKLVGERSVFCPPRMLLPEHPEAFCLFLDELPAAAPEVQKAFYSLLLERRLGEHRLPVGTWVVAAGNRVEDRALVRTMSSALVNRVVVLHIRVDLTEWLQWAAEKDLRSDVRSFIAFLPDALSRPAPNEPAPFSSPRSWTQLSTALDALEAAGGLTDAMARALALGLVSPEDAWLFSSARENQLPLCSLADMLDDASKVPNDNVMAMWLTAQRLRMAVAAGQLDDVDPASLNRLLGTFSPEMAMAALVGMVADFGRLGADPAMLEQFRVVIGR